MPKMTILNLKEKNIFESPPKFSGPDRKYFFYLTERLKNILINLKSPTNKVCLFILTGYFKASQKFFLRNFYKSDIEYITNQLGYNSEKINKNNYEDHTYRRHKKIILEYFGFKEFNCQTGSLLKKEIDSMIKSQLKPKLILFQIIDILKRKKIEIPTYNILANLIIDRINKNKIKLMKIIDENLNDDLKCLLNSLLEKRDNNELNLKVLRYKLTFLKKFSQSTKPTKIRKNIEDLKSLRKVFEKFKNILLQMNLTNDGIAYYAGSVIKFEIFQLIRRKNNDKYLHLIAFVTHQYFKLQDILIDILLLSVQNVINSSKREHKEKYYAERESRQQTVHNFTDYIKKSISWQTNLEIIINQKKLSVIEKFDKIKQSFDNTKNERENIQSQLLSFETHSEGLKKNIEYYNILETKSLKLQNKVSNIIKNLEFNSKTSEKSLIEAIEYYKTKDGNVDKNSPENFLESNEKEIIFSKEKFRISLYKTMLFIKIAVAIKSGQLNLIHSYKYRSLDEYLIQKDKWNNEKIDYLERSDLSEFDNANNLLNKLKNNLKKQYILTNNNVNSGLNKHFKLTSSNLYTLKTPKIESSNIGSPANLFPEKHYISLSEILITVNLFTDFMNDFKHWRNKYTRNKPSYQTFLAGITGYGCNVGIKKMAQISKNISESELENTVNWYFSLDNIREANNSVLKVIKKLELSNMFKKDKNILHTSSDGQKFNVAIDSLNANYSFKYFGKNKGVSVYSFIDESHLLFYSTVISSSEREAAYVIDGLLHNDVIKSDIHSTDTHGYTEVVFGVMYLLGFTYAPRIKNFQKQYIYDFKNNKNLKKDDFIITSQKYINTKIIKDNWDDILRFVSTIRLKKTTASQLFKRLNSYSNQHHLYKALKEFGKIIKTNFLLNSTVISSYYK